MKKGIIIGIIIGSLLFGGLGVYATAQILSKDISYTKKDGSTISIEEAINNLYDKEINSSKNDFYFIGWKTATGWNSQALEAGYNYSEYADWSSYNLTFKESGTYKVRAQIIRSSGSPKYQLIKNGTLMFQLNTTNDTKTTNFSYEMEYDIEINAGDVVYGKMYGGGDKTFYITYFSKI